MATHDNAAEFELKDIDHDRRQKKIQKKSETEQSHKPYGEHQYRYQ